MIEDTVRDTVRGTKKDAEVLFNFRIQMLEPVVRVELTTCCLRISCAPIHWHPHLSNTPSECGCSFHSFYERLPVSTPLAICWQYAAPLRKAK
jgi:hypothetical protein